MAELPTGTVTFLFTDLEGSSRLWEQHPAAMKDALARHDGILRNAIVAHDGYVVKTTGDGVHAAFADVVSAMYAARDAQRVLMSELWEATGRLSVRMGLHTGPAELRDGDYYGTAVNRAARLMSVAHGGQIVCSQSTIDLARDASPDGVGFLDLGEHRLRDLSRAERVFQLCAPGLRVDFGPLRSLDTVRGNLPVQLSSFVGRDADRVEVASALQAARVVTLIGVGGVGKTRLALRCATDVRAQYRDGVWWCELAGVRDADAVPDAVLGVFALEPREGHTTMDAMLAFLRAKELLLVLDNCEHLTRRVAQFVQQVEQSCPGVRVLATSREGLKVGGEQIVMVGPLDVPDEGVDLETVRESDAVRLFSERGRAARPDFDLDDSNSGAVLRLCRRLDGLPLAIELAASRLSVLTPDELAHRLDHRFQLLTGGERTAMERHQTLRAAIDWSYDLLSRPEQRLFDRLGVFAGGFTLDAVETICADDEIPRDEVLELLARLVTGSLVVAEVEGKQTRYRLLETVRQYAQEHLAAAEGASRIRAAHASYYTQFAETAAVQLAGADELEWVARLARDTANLSAALTWALDRADVDVALRLTGLCDYHYGSATEIGRTLRAAAATALALPGVTEHELYPVVLVQAGWDAHGLGDTQTAGAYARDALAAYTQHGEDPRATYWTLRSAVAMASGHPDEAAQHQEQAITIFRAAGEMLGLATSLAIVAANRASRDLPTATAAAEEAAQLAPALDSARARAQVLGAAGFALAEVQPDRGLTLLRQSLAEAEELGPGDAGMLAAMTAGVAARRGDDTGALALFATAIRDLRWTGASIELGAILQSVGALLVIREPETTAVLEGATARLGGRWMTSTWFAELGRRASAVLDDALGERRCGELRNRGHAMDETESTEYALAAIKRVLAHRPGSMGRRNTAVVQ
jgi:predicted ATPase/class 3 adenylate cyclase